MSGRSSGPPHSHRHCDGSAGRPQIVHSRRSIPSLHHNARMAAGRIRIGVVGCGLISQVMHLPYLSELGDRFELVAVCDIAPEVAGGCAERYGVSRVFSRWEDLIAEPLDAVLVATSGDHAPIAIAAARAGRHVMVEKPLALCSRDAQLALEA